jgi:hypothetical protein
MKKLTKNEKIKWFFENYYESGMELDILLKTMKNIDFDNFEWYGKKIKFPKFKTPQN